MSKIIKGSDFVMYLQKGGKNVPVCCSTEIALQFSSEIIEVTKHPIGVWKAFIGGNLEWSISSNSIVTLESGVDVNDIYTSIVLRKPIEFFFMVKGEKTLFYSGKVLISTFDIKGGSNDVVTYIMTAKGDGVLNINNPYEISVVTDGDGNPMEDGEGNIIYWQEHGNLNEIDLTVDC